jgi:hypothetical protein
LVAGGLVACGAGAVAYARVKDAKVEQAKVEQTQRIVHREQMDKCIAGMAKSSRWDTPQTPFDRIASCKAQIYLMESSLKFARDELESTKTK